MKKWIHSKTYIVDSDLIDLTDRAIKLPVAGRGEHHPRYYVYFPLKTKQGKDIVKLSDLGNRRTKVLIEDWILESKRKSGDILLGDDILTTL